MTGRRYLRTGERRMLIVIDLFGDDDVAKSDDTKQCAEAERRQREQWLEWVKYREAVVPQVVPVTQR